MLTKLITHHMDAWGLTFTISLFVLVIHNALSPSAILLTITLAVCNWLGFAINDYFDAPYDVQEEQKAARNFFTQQTTVRPRLLIIVLGLLSSAIFIMLARFGGRGVMVFLVGYVAMWAYSAPLLRLKSRPGLDLVMHTLFVQTFPYYVTLFLLDLSWLPVDYVLLTTFFLASLTAQLEQQVRDYELDRQTDMNFTVLIGLPLTMRLLRFITLLLMLNFLVNVWVGNIPTYLVPFAFIALPILVHRFIRNRHQPRSETLVRLTLLATLLYATLVLMYLMIL